MGRHPASNLMDEIGVKPISCILMYYKLIREGGRERRGGGKEEGVREEEGERERGREISCGKEISCKYNSISLLGFIHPHQTILSAFRSSFQRSGVKYSCISIFVGLLER